MEKKVDEKLKRTAAHILAMAVLRKYPDAKLSIGPATEDGFFYEFGVAKNLKKQQNDLFPKLEKEIEKIIDAELPITQTYIKRDEAIDMLHQQGQIFKAELLQSTNEEEISFYRIGDEYIDLNRKPLAENTSELGAVKLTSIDKVHWLNDEERPELWRINGIAFATKKELKKYLEEQAKLKERVHTKTGQKYHLFAQQSASDCVLLKNGANLQEIINRQLISAMQQEGAELIEFNQFKLIKDLEKSEHSSYYSEEELIELNKTIAYANTVHYDAVPVHIKTLKEAKSAKKTIQSKLIAKLDCLDVDALNQKQEGIYNTAIKQRLISQYTFEKTELNKNLRELITIIVSYYKKILGTNLELVINSQTELEYPEIGDILSEFSLNIRKKRQEDIADITITHKDIFAVSHEVATITFKKDIAKTLSNKSNKNLVFVEARLVENMQLLLAILTEKYDGDYPISISPYQAVIIPETAEVMNYANSIYKQLSEKGMRVVVANGEGTLEKKVKQAEEDNYPYILTVNESDKNNSVFSVKTSEKEDLGLMNINEFLQKIAEMS
jgi:threonyl-tRNA synthetase